MISRKKMLVVILLLLTCVGCDQATKVIAQASLTFSTTHTFFNDFLRLQYAENAGGMMSLGAGLPAEVRFWFLTVFVGLMLACILLFALFSRRLSHFQIAGLTLIVGGGLSNLLDRLRNDGHVIDFVTIGIGTVRTAIFNLADVTILAGTLLLILSVTAIRREAL